MCPSETVFRVCVVKCPVFMNPNGWVRRPVRTNETVFIKCNHFIVEDFLCYNTRVLIPPPLRGGLKHGFDLHTLSILTLPSEIYIL